jgi:multidrug efflux pump subunit AcrB
MQFQLPLLALVLGLLVDNSIVVLENIDHHLQMGKNSFQAALEVANLVLVSTLVIIKNSINFL